MDTKLGKLMDHKISWLSVKGAEMWLSGTELPNNSFKPKPLRSGKGMAERACHAFACATQVGLTQVLGRLLRSAQRDTVAA